MNRRTFLNLSGLAATNLLASRFVLGPRERGLGSNRLNWWQPDSNPLTQVEWRYTAGRIVDGEQDFGFIVSVSYIRIPGSESQELLVQRQDFTGQQAFAGKIYTGTLSYEEESATYIFQDEAEQELARWQWDESEQQYGLQVTTAELTLSPMTLIPQGGLIAEGGDGDILVGHAAGFLVASDYHADWTAIEIEGEARGAARVDMQGLRPSLATTALARKVNGRLRQWLHNDEAVGGGDSEYDHHWFATAVELEDGTPAWVSAWRIEDSQGPFWALTIAQGSGASWQVNAFTEENSLDLLQIRVLTWQDLPPGAADERQKTGQRWRLTNSNVDVDLEIAVPPGQFTTSGRQGGLANLSWMLEGVGVEVSGTIFGKKVQSVKVAVAESTAEFYLQFIPAILG